ncbi:MAG: hypothetical protein K2X77_25805 [Candidatus Obscuribacterales bacterium]|nr:hypothetical protein [Candidatus Obscuribacterales bacterium]
MATKQNTNYKVHQERRNEYVSSSAKLIQQRTHLRCQMEGLHHMWHQDESVRMPALMSDLSVRIRRQEQVSLEG